MEEQATRLWEDPAGRIGGAMSFRLILQPAVAIYFAIRDGLNDARAQRPLYSWNRFHRSGAAQ